MVGRVDHVKEKLSFEELINTRQHLLGEHGFLPVYLQALHSRHESRQLENDPRLPNELASCFLKSAGPIAQQRHERSFLLTDFIEFQSSYCLTKATRRAQGRSCTSYE